MSLEVAIQNPETGQMVVSNPYRDIAHFFPLIVADVRNRLSWANLNVDERDAVIQAFPSEEAAGVAMVSAYRALTLFMLNSIAADVKTVQDNIEKSGFLDVPFAAQQLVLAKVAQAALGAFWAGRRSSTKAGEVPDVLQYMVSNAGLTLEAFGRPRGVKASLVNLYRECRRALGACFGRKGINGDAQQRPV